MLQSDTRTNLKRALEGYGEALNAVPTVAEDSTQDPGVQGLTGAQAINKTFRYGGKAGRTSAIVNQAFLGEHPHDLSALIRAQRDLFAKLASTDGALSDLITNFNVTAGAFASESANLSASVRELAPTLQAAEPSLRHLNDALPWARRLARESLPGIRELPATIHAGSPWLVQAGKLLRPSELGGTARLLAASAPGLAKAGHASLKLFPQIGMFGRCVSENLVPAGNVVINGAGGYPFSTGQPNIRELFYGVAQLAGESQGFDGNGPFVRFQTGGGDELVRAQNPKGAVADPANDALWANNISAPIDTRPRLPLSTEPGFTIRRRSGWTFPVTRRRCLSSTPGSPPRPPEPGGGAMRRAIREHLRDFVAIGVLVVLAIITTGVILASQTTLFPGWIPGIGDDKFELKAEFSSAQAVTPGQGQTVTIAGINVGQVSGSELDSGRAIVTMQIDHKYAELIHPDASLLCGRGRAPGHDDPGRSRHGRPARRGGLDAAARQLAAERPAGPDLRLPGWRYPLLPPALLQAASQGLQGDDGRSSPPG